MVQRVLKNTFTRGVISPAAYARNDIAVFSQGAETLENWLVMKEGGVTKRPGTYYRGATKETDTDVRLVDFVFSSTQAYVLEFGDEYVRFWYEAAQVQSGMSPYEVVSPFTEAVLRDLCWQQDSDALYIVCGDDEIPPKKLLRSAHTSWAFSDVDFRDGPYLPINDQANSISTDIALTTGATVTVTFSNTNNVNGGSGFVSTDVGRHFRCQFKGSWSWGVISAVNSTTEIEVDIEEGNGGGGAGSDALNQGGVETLATIDADKEIGSTNLSEFDSLSWRLGAFSETTGYPKSMSFFQSRTVWGRTSTAPRTMWYSRSNYPAVMSPSDVDGTVTDSHGGMIEIRGLRADEILWLQESVRLQVGTASAIRTVGAADGGEFGPRNVNQRNEVSSGTIAVRPAGVGSSTIHASRFGRGLNDLIYDFNVNSLIAPKISTVSEHIFKPVVREVVYQETPMSLLWGVLEDGTLVASTIERYEKVIGFSTHDIGGTVLSAASIPGTSTDVLYLVVRRTINGSQVQYMETLADPFDSYYHDKEDAHFVDCGGVYDSTATNTVSGITWLANTEVSILADGAVLPNATVSVAGVLTLPNSIEASVVHFGLPLTAEGKTLRAPIALQDGPGLGRKCRVATAYVDVFETLGLELESDTVKVDQLAFRGSSDNMNQSPPLYSGTREAIVDGSWDSAGQITFRSFQPLPATIRAFNFFLETD